MNIPQPSGRVELTDSVIFRLLQGVHSVAFDASDLNVFKRQGSQVGGSGVSFKRKLGAQSGKREAVNYHIKTIKNNIRYLHKFYFIKNKLDYMKRD